MGKTRWWAFRLGALGVGLSGLLLIEGIVRLTGSGQRDPLHDPFVGFSEIPDFFALNPLTNRFETAPGRLKFFIKDGFARKKSSHTFRIFCLGGSTVQGRPWSIETAFPTWLRLHLEAAFPERRFEVVNVGGVSYASYRLVPILAECLNHEPDLILLCTGHNEFLEARSYPLVRQWPVPLRNALSRMTQLHSYRLVEQVAGRISSRKHSAPRERMGPEVDALLDYRGGLQAYFRDDEWKRGVIQHFEANVSRMVELCSDQSTPVWLLSPPVNLKDSPPFKSERGQGSADYWYRQGRKWLARPDIGRAKAAFWRAVEEDLCPLRMLPVMREVMVTIANENGVPHLDLHPLVRAGAGELISGSESLVDHIHPTIRGNDLIGLELAKRLIGSDLLPAATANWEGGIEERYQKQIDDLGELYFAHGQQRLSNLRAWTQGRADGPPIRNRLMTGVKF
ncbi:MAG: SGNH/GDSL hydrolase family protein [Verrucomicrobiota bacterium]